MREYTYNNAYYNIQYHTVFFSFLWQLIANSCAFNATVNEAIN